MERLRMNKTKKTKVAGHRHNGNCWEGFGPEEDVCTDHEEPRGECSVCEPCAACALALESDKDRGTNG